MASGLGRGGRAWRVAGTIQLAEQQGENEDRLFIQAAIANSNSYAGRTEVPTNLAYMKQARKRAQRLGSPSHVVLLDMHIAKFERLNSEFNTAFRRFQQANAKAAAMDDPELTSAANVFNPYFLFWQGRFKEVIAAYEKTVPDIQKIPIGYFPTLAALMIGHCYTMIGQVTHGLGMLDHLRSYCLENGDHYMAAHASSSIAMALLPLNRIDDALRYLESALKEARKSQNHWVKAMAVLMTCLAHYVRGDAANAGCSVW